MASMILFPAEVLTPRQIRHETLRVAVIQKLEDALDIQTDGRIEFKIRESWNRDPDEDEDVDTPVHESRTRFEPFKDIYKRRFMWYYESYFATVQQNMDEYKDGTKFEIMPFEHGGNVMEGKFVYSELGKRLIRIKEAINEETNRWAEDAIAAKQRDTTKFHNLQRAWARFEEQQKSGGIPNVSVELDNNNPSIWILTYFGKPSTDLEGGVFRIRVSLSLNFPEEQPRVRIETPVYHHRVSKDGILCYFPDPMKLGNMTSHILAIVDVLEDESPPYDPRTIVNAEASKLMWGSTDDKKKYKRQVRRSAQRSVEDE